MILVEIQCIFLIYFCNYYTRGDMIQYSITIVCPLTHQPDCRNVHFRSLARAFLALSGIQYRRVVSRIVSGRRTAGSHHLSFLRRVHRSRQTNLDLERVSQSHRIFTWLRSSLDQSISSSVLTQNGSVLYTVASCIASFSFLRRVCCQWWVNRG